MFRLLFQPAISLMNRLSYPAKFALVMALFAVPMVITGMQNMLSMRTQIAETEHRREGVYWLGTYVSLIPLMERIRDLSVTQRESTSDQLAELYQDSRRKALEKIEQLLTQAPLQKESLVMLSLQNLKRQVQEMRVSTGSEGDNLSLIFESMHRAVHDAYELQQRLANEFGVSADTDWVTAQLYDILSEEFKVPQIALGRARGFGTFFLNKNFMTSSGIGMLESTYHQLSASAEQLEQRFTILLSAQPELEAQHPLELTAIAGLTETRLLVEDQLLLQEDLSLPWKDYFDTVTGHMESLNVLRVQLIQALDTRYHNRLQVQRELWIKHLLAVGGLVLLSVYLFVGFYFSVRRTVDRLILAAHQVAEGALSEPVTVEAKDEMRELADMMNAMRIQLYDRQQQLLEMTVTDGLTGIHNRKYFNDQIQRQLKLAHEHQKSLALLLVDIDYFKRLNDEYGHPVGDLCLKEVAKCLTQALQRPEDSVARYGGEEFAAILPDTSTEGARLMAERICRSIRAIVLRVNGEDIHMTVSIGVATTEQLPGCSVEALIKSADIALYQAKHSGRNRWMLAVDKNKGDN